MINSLNRSIPIVDESGKMESRFQDWAANVTRLDIIDGNGSPEGVVEASQRRLYMDLTGTAGAILYIKRDADVGGDRSQGWILV